jgi:hypothetical protein
MERPAAHTETSLGLLLCTAAGAGTALAVGALVAGGGSAIALLAFAGTFAFGIAADGRAEATLARIRRPRP